MTALASKAHAAKVADWDDIRIVGRHYGKSLLGPEFDVAIGDKYFRIGALTLRLLETGTPASDLDMMEIDWDAEEQD